MRARGISIERVTMTNDLFGLIDLIHKQREIMPAKGKDRIDKIKNRADRERPICARDQIWVHGVFRAIQCNWFKPVNERTRKGRGN